MEPYCSARGTLWTKWGQCHFVLLLNCLGALIGFQQLSFTLHVTCKLSTSKRRTLTPGRDEGEEKQPPPTCWQGWLAPQTFPGAFGHRGQGFGFGHQGSRLRGKGFPEQGATCAKLAEKNPRQLRGNVCRSEHGLGLCPLRVEEGW